MSINVTVTGNPVSIKRGKMVCSDLDCAKQEFDKRRLMRLEQVRQQSKEIAEDVRNKVRKQKCKQLSQIEKEGKKKIKDWQTRKLLELQNQYQEAVSNLGIGHKGAEVEREEQELLLTEIENNGKIAQERGRKAEACLQNESQKNSYKAVLYNKHRNNTDLIEARGSFRSNRKKCLKNCKSKRRKKVQKSDAEDVQNLVYNDDVTKYNICSGTEDTTTEYSSSEQSVTDSDDSSKDIPVKENTSVFNNDNKIPTHKKPIYAESINKKNAPTVQTEEKSVQVTAENSTDDTDRRNLDTRISERIRNRALSTKGPDYCDMINGRICNCSNFIISCDNGHCRIESTENKRAISASRNDSEHIKQTHAKSKYTENDTELDDKKALEEIPTKPKIVLKSAEQEKSNTSIKSSLDPNKVMYYDHRNQFSKQTDNLRQAEKIEEDDLRIFPKPKIASKSAEQEKSNTSIKSSLDPNKVTYYDHRNQFSKQIDNLSQAEKIEEEDLRISPNGSDNVEYYDTMYKRDKDARMRGQKALEKERTQREYNELLKKLPLLQKQQRICEINTDKPEYHMSDDRLREVERRRQNKMDNAYEKLFPQRKPAIVTIPPKVHPEKETEVTPFKIIGTNGKTPILNLGTWDVDKLEKNDSVEKPTEKPTKNRTEQLQQLLASLNNQKQLLLKEIQDLPSGSNLTNLLENFNSTKEKDHSAASLQKNKRKRSSNKQHSPPNYSESENETQQSKKSSEYISKTSSPSPKKKAKIKQKRDVLVLQNTSTQTTPKAVTNTKTVPKNVTSSDISEQVKTVEIEKNTNALNAVDEEKNCKKIHKPCDCFKIKPENAEDLCQIIIKIKEDEKPEILIQQPNNVKEFIVQGPLDISDKRHEEKRKTETTLITEKTVLNSIPYEIKQKTLKALLKDRSKILDEADLPDKTNNLPEKNITKPKKSWREQLSKNSSRETTSTSYYSPPDFNKYKDNVSQTEAASKPQTPTQPSKPFKSLLKDKPQQLNMLTETATSSNSSFKTTKQLDPRLMKYIRKLIKMSRSNVDDLSVTTVSEVSTPSESIINMESNNISPLAQLQNIMKYFNLSVADLQENLTYSTNGNTSEISTVQNLTLTSSNGSQVNKQSTKKTISHKTNQDNSLRINERLNDSTSAPVAVPSDFTKIAESCANRISNLTAMIEKVRKEKQKILQSPTGSSDKDHSTVYYELPVHKENSDEVDKISDTSKDMQEELDKKLLEIDYGLSNKLKKLTPLEFKNLDISEIKKSSSSDSANDQKDSDQQLFQRLQNLLESPSILHSTEKTDKTIGVCLVNEQSNKENNQNFMLDIPKLVPPQIDMGSGDYSNWKFHRRPPPSKGLTIAKRFNGNIINVPHELSTIIEADSQLSLKNDTISPKNDSIQILDDNQKLIDNIVTKNSEKNSNECKSSSSSDIVKEINKICSETHSDVSPKITDLSKNILVDSSSISSEDKSDMEAVEKMLRSIGMQWAISTLRKTKETLALTSSSSSSIDLDKKKKTLSTSTENTSSISEISLKEFLNRQLTAKISSSTLKSDASPNSLLGDSQEISAIQATNISVEKTNQRTSTPIQTSKSTDKSKQSNKPMFSDESDLSSLRDTSQEKAKKNYFYSLSESKD